MRTIVGLLVILCLGCGGSESPTRPTPGRPSPDGQPAQYTLSGPVSDTAFRPVADVRIEVVEGDRAGVAAITGTDGHYAFPGTFAGAIRVRASKGGYIDVVTRHDPSTWTQDQQQLGFTMKVSSPSVDLTGRYTLTLTAADGCTLPPEMRTRTYPVSIAQRQGRSEPHQYEAVLERGTFVAAPLVGRFSIDVAGTFGYVYLGNPYDWLDAIVEEVAPTTYLIIYGFGGLTVDQSPIAGTLEWGGFEYCASSTTPVTDGRYHCPAATKCGLQRFELVKR